VLSHHVDDFALVSAFFLFAIGCLNILVGLVWRQSAKSKRSFTSWRDQAKSALPTHVAGVDVRPMMPSKPPSFMSSMFSGDERHHDSDTGSSKPGFGFGRQGEKAAGLNGVCFLLVDVCVLMRWWQAILSPNRSNPFLDT
jgi:hypothetical protein